MFEDEFLIAWIAQLDTKAVFAEDVKKVSSKAWSIATTLRKIMPKVNGPEHARRKLIYNLAYR